MATRWERWSAVSGLLYVALFVLALVVLGETGDTAEEVRDYYEAHESRIFLGFFLAVGAAVALLTFVSTLRSTLAAVEPEPRPLTALGFAAGVVTSALLVAGAATFAAPAEQEEGSLDPGAADALDTASYFLITGGVMVASLLVLATSLVALRTQVFPRWLAWAGLVVAPIVFFAPFFFPVVLFLAWVLAVSVVLLARRPEPVPSVTSRV